MMMIMMVHWDYGARYTFSFFSLSHEVVLVQEKCNHPNTDHFEVFFKMENCIIVETQVMMMIRLVVKVRICLHLFVNVIVSLFKLPSEKKVMHDFHVWCVWESLSRPFGGQVKWMSKGKSREKKERENLSKKRYIMSFPFLHYIQSQLAGCWLGFSFFLLLPYTFCCLMLTTTISILSNLYFTI